MAKGRRLERLTERVKQDLSEIIAYQLKDPRVGFATVTRVQLAPDLTRALVFVSVMGSEGRQRASLRALQHARGHIQSQIARRLRVRRHPIMTFELDKGLKHSLEVARILSELREETAGDAPQPESETAAPAESEPPDEEEAAP